MLIFKWIQRMNVVICDKCACKNHFGLEVDVVYLFLILECVLGANDC